MKKILLAAGGMSGTLSLAPLYCELQKHASYDPVAVFAVPEGSEPVSRDLASRFGLDDECRTVFLPPGSAVRQLAAAMTGMESVMLEEKPDLVLVCGSDNAALGAALTAAKLSLPVAAIDAGLRSYQRSDGEEANRVVIDAMADFHFVSEHSGEYNLINEGVADEKVFYSGNLAIDSLVGLMEQAHEKSPAAERGILPKKYLLALLNPAGPADGKAKLELMRSILTELSGSITVVMPLGARLEELLREEGLLTEFSELAGLQMIADPELSELLTMLRDSVLLLTDTEELQSEATVMNVPCLTMMESTARPSTIEIGTNVLVGLDEEEIKGRMHDILHPGSHKHVSSRSKIPEKWDGASAARIVAVLDRVL